MLDEGRYGSISEMAASEADAAALAERLPAVAAGFRQGVTRPAVAGGGREVGYSTEAGRAPAAAAARATARRPHAFAESLGVARTTPGAAAPTWTAP